LCSSVIGGDLKKRLGKSKLCFKPKPRSTVKGLKLGAEIMPA
jgi:hypothetical protein